MSAWHRGINIYIGNYYVLRKCTRALNFSFFENVEQWEEAQRQKELEKAAVEEEAVRVQRDASAAEYKREQVVVFVSCFSLSLMLEKAAVEEEAVRVQE